MTIRPGAVAIGTRPPPERTEQRTRYSVYLRRLVFKAGDRVVVQGRTSADAKSFIARRVHALPAAEGAGERATHLVGSVTISSASSLTIKLADGSSQSVAISADTKIRPQGKTVADLTVGTKVTVVSKNGTANGIVVMPA